MVSLFYMLIYLYERGKMPGITLDEDRDLT